MSCVEEIKRLLQAQRYQPVTYGRGATDQEIRAAESVLRLQFPECYRSFLRSIGWIASPYISVFGLGSDADMYDLISCTIWERDEAGLSLSSNLLPIVNDGAGNLYCLDLSQMQNSECPVVFWDHESFAGAGQIPTVVGPDFCVWIIDEINQLGA